MKSPNCGVKLFLCECRGPRLEWSSAVQWEEGRLAVKSVTARPPSFHNDRQWVPRNIWTKVASLAIYGEGDVLFCFFPPRAWQVPTLLFGEAGLTHSCREASELQAKQLRELTAKALPGVRHCSTTGTTLVCTDGHTVYPVHRVVHVPVANPNLSAGFPVSSHYKCSNLTIPAFILL